MKETPLCSSKKHSKASLKKTGQGGQSSGKSDLEEASSTAAERTQLEKLTPSVLQPAPHSELEQCNSKTASSLMAARKERMKRRMKNNKNSQKAQSNISTCPNPASDGDNQLQTMKDIAMETGVVTQRRINCGSRARRQLQVVYVYTSYICITGQLASIQLYDYCRTGNFCGHEIFCYNSWLDSYTENIICEVIIVILHVCMHQHPQKFIPQIILLIHCNGASANVFDCKNFRPTVCSSMITMCSL